MGFVTFGELQKEGTYDLGSTTLDLLAETPLTDIIPLPEKEGYRVPDSFSRDRPDGSRDRGFQPKVIYDLKHRPQKLEVSTDRPSDFNERRINIADKFLHFASLQSPSRELSAKLEGDNRILVDDSLELGFHRTLRMPDDNKVHPLPASRGLFALYNVKAFAARLPERITMRGGILFPMWQREALWINFNNRDS